MKTVSAREGGRAEQRERERESRAGAAATRRRPNKRLPGSVSSSAPRLPPPSSFRRSSPRTPLASPPVPCQDMAEKLVRSYARKRWTPGMTRETLQTVRLLRFSSFKHFLAQFIAFFFVRIN